MMFLTFTFFVTRKNFAFTGYIQAPKGHSWRYSNMLSSGTAFFFLFSSNLHLFSFLNESNSYMQFGSTGSLEQHGFARNKVWSIDTDPPPFPTSGSNKAFVDLILKPSEDDMKTWPHRYTSWEICIFFLYPI